MAATVDKPKEKADRKLISFHVTPAMKNRIERLRKSEYGSPTLSLWVRRIVERHVDAVEREVKEQREPIAA